MQRAPTQGQDPPPPPRDTDPLLCAQLRTHTVLLGECLGGALYTEDFVRLCREVGFADPRQLSSSVIEVRLPPHRQRCSSCVVGLPVERGPHACPRV